MVFNLFLKGLECLIWLYVSLMPKAWCLMPAILNLAL
jgi:hypothetical protein